MLQAYYCIDFLHERAVQQYEQQTEDAFETASRNIEYYISRCISSSKSIYTDTKLVTFLRQTNKDQITPTEKREMFAYLERVYYSIPEARQLFVAIPKDE